MTEKLVSIPIECLQRGKYQPRNAFDEKTLQELANSIAAQGLVQPLVVRAMGSEQYEIIAGERRWRAAQLAQLSVVPCLIKTYTDQEAAAIALIENIQRENLNPVEEALAYQRLINEFGYTHEALAEILGKTRTVITNRLRLLNLDTRVQEALKSGALSEGHGRVLAGLPTEQQYPLANQCIKNCWSVRKLEHVIKNNTSSHICKKPEIHFRPMEKTISEQLGTEVKIEHVSNEKGGYLRIRYYNLDQFSGILSCMGVNLENE